MLRNSLILLAAAFPLFGCAGQQPAWIAKYQAEETARLDKALAGMTSGEPVNCVDTRRVDGPESYGETTLIFRVSSRLVYRNETKGTCPYVGKSRAFVTKPFGSRICSGDIAHATDLQGGFSDTCVLGQFVPYRREKKSAQN